MNRLVVSYLPEDEWHGELAARVESDGFSGLGYGWFRMDQLRDFSASLLLYPLSAPLLLETGTPTDSGISQVYNDRAGRDAGSAEADWSASQ